MATTCCNTLMRKLMGISINVSAKPHKRVDEENGIYNKVSRDCAFLAPGIKPPTCITQLSLVEENPVTGEDVKEQNFQREPAECAVHRILTHKGLELTFDIKLAGASTYRNSIF